MKEEERDMLVGTIIIVVVVLLAVIGGYFGLKKQEKEARLCADQFDTIGYEDLERFCYENFNETHYNCCWDEVEVIDDGYYTKRKCKGFVRE